MARYRLHEFEDRQAFTARAEPFLLEREATHCLQLGLLPGIAAGEWEDPYLATVEEDGEVVFVAMRTPPFNLLLSFADDPGVLEPVLSRLARSTGESPTGVMGPRGLVRPFIQGWTADRGDSPRLAKRLRIYRLDEVSPVSSPDGEMRPASQDDRPLLEQWMHDFHLEALPHQPVSPHKTVDRWLEQPSRELMLWTVAGRPVAMAGAGSPTRNGIRVAAVYTPPEQRGRGYATALVARLSRRQLDSGRRFCFLFTDLDNPTSNSIYQKIGYRSVADIDEYQFEGRAPGAGPAHDSHSPKRPAP